MTQKWAPTPSKQRGVLLLETLIALLIFSVGILALVGLQALAIRQVADAKLRSDASYLANQIIAQMWIDRSNLADYVHQASGTNCTFTGSVAPISNTNFYDWLGASNLEGTVLWALPNAAVQVQVQTSTNLVTVTLCWRAPQENQTHNFTATALISG